MVIEPKSMNVIIILIAITRLMGKRPCYEMIAKMIICPTVKKKSKGGKGAFEISNENESLN